MNKSDKANIIFLLRHLFLNHSQLVLTRGHRQEKRKYF